MKPHAFVAMPFGVKKDSEGNEIDFNHVYAELIKPALGAVGLEVFRADDETCAGDIRTDMFQELLIADLMVKAGFEERWMLLELPDYAAYREGTWRFLPLIH